jgi:hypothetical protein
MPTLAGRVSGKCELTMLQAGKPTQSSFGKRSIPSLRAKPAAQPARAPRAPLAAVSDTGPAIDPDTLVLPRGSVRGSVAWAYIKACATAFAIVIALSVLFGGSHNPFAGKSFFQNIVGMVVAPTLGGVMAIPAFLLAQVVAFLGIRRGVADVLVGGMLGSAWLLLALSDGKAINSLHVAFLLGGCVGGFAFWRAQGYPGTTSTTAAVLDQVYARVR